MTLTLETVQNLADQLPTFEQARLIEHLSRKLVLATSSQSSRPVFDSLLPQPSESDSANDSWARFFAMSEELRAIYPDANPVAQLEADRRSRDESLHEHLGEIDVYH